jgi:hypothetical protein
MRTHCTRSHIAGIAAAVVVAGAAVAGGAAAGGSATEAASARAEGATLRATQSAKVVRLKDARLKFEINATDRDGGVQVFIDAESWKQMSIFDRDGRRLFRSTTSGRMGLQGGTELFLESAEPPFSELPVAKLLQRFPEGRYTFRGEGLGGERYVGSARLTHDLPDGPTLVSPLEGHPPQNPDDTTVVWKPVPPPKGSRIVGYQVLVVQPQTRLRALPKVTLDVMMPPSATSLRVPPGFLRRGTEYEWEVLAIEAGGNQTLSSSTFTTAP